MPSATAQRGGARKAGLSAVTQALVSNSESLHGDAPHGKAPEAEGKMIKKKTDALPTGITSVETNIYFDYLSRNRHVKLGCKFSTWHPPPPPAAG